MMIEPTVLEGEFVRLQPMQPIDLDALCEVGLEPELWRWTANECRTRDDMKKYMDLALQDADRGIALPFVTVERKTDTIVGSTRFGNIDIPNRKAEIGWTWINPRWQRSVVNTEAKLLMLTHAFDFWKCIRVELKTDALNEKSRKAIARIGGREEGTLRNHMIIDSGRYRDSVYFSIIESEWPDVKERLTNILRTSN